jgi:hypothetical protein
MVQGWWAAGLAVPAVIVKGFVSGRNKSRKEEEARARYAKQVVTDICGSF